MDMSPDGIVIPFPDFGSVMIRPQAATAIDIAPTAKPSRRIVLSPAARAVVVTSFCAFALHLAFPRTGAWWLIPFALAGLSLSWSSLAPRTAAWNGYISGLVFFTLSFSWFGETAGALLGPFAFIIDLGPAIGEAFAFAAVALVTAIAARRCPPALVPAVFAAAFTAAEWVRSSGFLGVPFGQLGMALIDSPLRPLAAFAGGYGLTFVVALVAAYAAASIERLDVRRTAAAVAVVAFACAGAAWLAWPARALAPATYRVAAIQGNIPQSIKATDAARLLAVQRYSDMTTAIAGAHPSLVVWPETVILTDIAADARARAHFVELARNIHAEIAVGTLARNPQTGALYNVLAYVAPDGATMLVAKRQLVPFAEFLPLPAALRALPGVDEIGDFTSGSGPQIDPRTHAGTLICWESVFGDVALDQVRAGARFFVVSTDDAWFGSSDGPYQHAQATTLRAVETGRWIVRAASTGISGIVAPDGTWRARSGLQTQETIVGDIGDPAPTFYDRVGPQPIGITLLVLALAAVVIPWRRRA
jgi:apolipoprotein N-acyltransferase